MSEKRQPALLFIFITLLIDVIGLGIIIPVLPTLLKEITGEGIDAAANYTGWLMMAFSIMQFIFSPILGSLSDKYGRRPILLLSLFGFGLDYILLAYAPNLTWLFIGRIIAGIMGASFTTASAYIADISTPEKRAQNFGLIGAAFGLGFIIGPVIGGLLGSFGPRIPFFAAAILTLVNFLYGYFILPESLPKDKRREFDWKRANPKGSIEHLFKYKFIAGLVLSLVIIYIASHAIQTNWSFFCIERFQWTERQIGTSLGAVGIIVALVQGLLIRYINPKLGNERSVYLGIFLYAAGFFLFAFANAGWMMYAFLIPYCLGGIAGPALQSMMSSAVPDNEQGELQGALTSLLSLTSIFGPLLMTGIFSYFIGPNTPFYFPGSSFFLGGVMTIISGILAYRALHPSRRE